MNIISKTAELLTGKKKHTAAELLEARRTITMRLSEIDRELTRLKNKGVPYALESGTADDLEKAESAIKALESEERQLLARRTRLHKEYQQAAGAAAIENAPADRKALADAVARAENLRAELAQAQAAVQTQVNTLRQQRQTTGNDARLDLPQELAERAALVIMGHSTLAVDVGDRNKLVHTLAPPRQQRSPAKGVA